MLQTKSQSRLFATTFHHNSTIASAAGKILTLFIDVGQT